MQEAGRAQGAREEATEKRKEVDARSQRAPGLRPGGQRGRGEEQSPEPWGRGPGRRAGRPPPGSGAAGRDAKGKRALPKPVKAVLVEEF